MAKMAQGTGVCDNLPGWQAGPTPGAKGGLAWVQWSAMTSESKEGRTEIVASARKGGER